MSTERLVREYVRALLREDAGGGDAAYTPGGIMSAGMSMGGSGPYGMHFGSGDELYKIFIKPFVDVVDTTLGKAKEMSVRTQTLARVAFEAIATTLIPVLTDDYKEIFEKEKTEIDKIRKEYGEVYKSNWDAFRDNDVLVASFFYAPAALLTYAFAKKSPKVAANLISVLSGGSLDPWLARLSKKSGGGLFSSSPAKTGLDYHGGPDFKHGYAYGGGTHEFPLESVMREDKEQFDVAKLLSSDKVKDVLERNPIVRRMEQQGRAIVRNTLDQVYKHARAIMTAKSLQELQQKTGVHLKGMDKLAQVPEEERRHAESAILTGARESMKEYYTRNLEGQLQTALDAGVPQDSPYISDFRRTISKIKAL